MRSAPPLDDCRPLLSSAIACHCAAASSVPAVPSVSAAGPAAESDSSARPHSAASASWSIWSFVAILSSRLSIPVASSLDDDLLEQDGRDVVGRDCGVDATRQFFLEAIETC